MVKWILKISQKNPSKKMFWMKKNNGTAEKQATEQKGKEKKSRQTNEQSKAMKEMKTNKKDGPQQSENKMKWNGIKMVTHENK